MEGNALWHNDHQSLRKLSIKCIDHCAASKGICRMNDTAQFSRVTQSSRPLYGPRKLLVCGYTSEGQTALMDIITAMAMDDLPVIYAVSADLEESLSNLLSRPADTGQGEPSRMPAAIIMSGITENELHQLIGRYRDAGLPSPLWATLTPTSERWTLRQLLTELSAEKMALQKGQSDN